MDIVYNIHTEYSKVKYTQLASSSKREEKTLYKQKDVVTFAIYEFCYSRIK